MIGRVALALALVLALTGTADAKRLTCRQARNLATLALDVAEDCAPPPACVKHTPYARFMEHVRLLEPGETATVEVLFRNADGIGCAPTCFLLSQGYHFPHEGSDPLRVYDTGLWKADGTPLWNVCLAPGDEAVGFYRIEADVMQDGPGYVTPSIFLWRTTNRGTTERDFMVDQFDTEGPAMCGGYSYGECRAFVYDTQPPT